MHSPDPSQQVAPASRADCQFDTAGQAAVDAPMAPDAFWLGDWLVPDDALRAAAVRWYRWRVRMEMIGRAILYRRRQARRHYCAARAARVRTTPWFGSQAAPN